ncbi:MULTISPECIES: 4'-phosphopantetheinyl transferase family protein [unclassified Streptomyces]|uniref:4'-phosphopantetheinyl transferase family protein n=1 Tax=unclassified Streptomyces TaxID=2593676 RepID=UPI00382E16BB
MNAPARPPRTDLRPVDVWWARPADVPESLVDLLDPVERARHDATPDPANRQRFLAGCALTRIVLGDLLGIGPAAVPLRRVCPRCSGPHGKVTADTGTDLRFNISHSGDVVGLAVCRGADVGLDVEDARTATDVEAVAPRTLGATELAALRARPPAERPAAFLRYWTRKEAVLKALGVGLRVPPRRLHVTDPALAPAVLALPEKIGVRREVRMADTLAGETHPASVAVTGTTEVSLVQHPAPGALRARR